MNIRNLIFFLIYILSSTGCVRQTLTIVPGLSGVVVDSNTGKPLENIKINGGLLALSDGQFALAATSEKVWVIQAPGERGDVSRNVVFQKEGYRDTTCTTKASAFYAEEVKATIPMVKVDKSESTTGSPILLQLKDVWVECQVFVGSWVLYNDEVHLVGEIYQQEQGGMKKSLFALWPAHTHNEEMVMDILGYDLRLITKKSEDE